MKRITADAMPPDPGSKTTRLRDPGAPPGSASFSAHSCGCMYSLFRFCSLFLSCHKFFYYFVPNCCPVDCMCAHSYSTLLKKSLNQFKNQGSKRARIKYIKNMLKIKNWVSYTQSSLDSALKPPTRTSLPAQPPPPAADPLQAYRLDCPFFSYFGPSCKGITVFLIVHF